MIDESPMMSGSFEQTLRASRFPKDAHLNQVETMTSSVPDGGTIAPIAGKQFEALIQVPEMKIMKVHKL